MRVTKYCTPAMLPALTDRSKGYPIPSPQYWPLRSRGWVNPAGEITQAGLTYLASKTNMSSLLNEGE